MKKLVIATAALIAMGLSAPAFAADMPVKGKVYDKMYDWSGFYIGSHTGYLWGDNDWTHNDAAVTGQLDSTSTTWCGASTPACRRSSATG